MNKIYELQLIAYISDIEDRKNKYFAKMEDCDGVDKSKSFVLPIQIQSGLLAQVEGIANDIGQFVYQLHTDRFICHFQPNDQEVDSVYLSRVLAVFNTVYTYVFGEVSATRVGFVTRAKGDSQPSKDTLHKFLSNNVLNSRLAKDVVAGKYVFIVRAGLLENLVSLARLEIEIRKIDNSEFFLHVERDIHTPEETTLNIGINGLMNYFKAAKNWDGYPWLKEIENNYGKETA